MVRLLALAAVAVLMLLSATQSNGQLPFHKKKKVNKSTNVDNTAEPDKVLYDRATNDIKHGRHEVGRLGLQTLINTYPDSEYLAKAKLAIADSYYKEGGTANMTQAIQGYKDFIVFFPFLQEASYAQLQVANAHYQQMAKPDRDRSEARAAEEELQTFLEKYPKDPLAPKAEQRLRDVQEVIAEGDYRVGYYYYMKGDRRAAAARLISVTRRYPLYSKSDHALWMLGDIFEKSEHKEIAAIYYANIVRDYPLSAMAGESKDKLKAFKVPVPQPDPNALARMKAEQNTPRKKAPIYKAPLQMVHNGPGTELVSAARHGAPNLAPEADDTSATDIMTGGGQTRIASGGGASGGNSVVATVTPGSSTTNSSGSSGTAENSGGAESGTDARPEATGAKPDTPEDPNAAPAANGAAPAAPANAGAPAAAPDVAKPDGAAANGSAANGSAANGATSNAAPAAGQNAEEAKPADASQGAQSDQQQSSGDQKNQKESSSKKKKHKFLPW